MKLVASFDDGAKGDLIIAELLNKYGIKDVTFYIPSMWQSYNILEKREPLSLIDVNQIASKYKIGSHTITHPMLTRIPLQQAFDEIVRSKHQLEKLITLPVESFCFPRGYANDQIRNIVSKYYKSARNTLIGTIDPPEDPFWQSTSVHVAGNKRKEYKDTHWLKEALKLLHAASVKKDSVFHFWGHSHEIDKFDEWDNFETLLKELSDE